MKKARVLKSLPNIATYDEMESPVGKLIIIASDAGLHAILWDGEKTHITKEMIKNSRDKIIVATKKQLQEYFQGKRKQFDLPLAASGTEFQIKAWKQLSKIPYAKTISYGEQAQRLGDKNKARAVGMANRFNPLSIVVPCHRVIGSNNKLVGFAGGLDRKAYLLALEAQHS